MDMKLPKREDRQTNSSAGSRRETGENPVQSRCCKSALSGVIHGATGDNSSGKASHLGGKPEDLPSAIVNSQFHVGFGSDHTLFYEA